MSRENECRSFLWESFYEQNRRKCKLYNFKTENMESTVKCLKSLKIVKSLIDISVPT